MWPFFASAMMRFWLLLKYISVSHYVVAYRLHKKAVCLEWSSVIGMWLFLIQKRRFLRRYLAEIESNISTLVSGKNKALEMC